MRILQINLNHVRQAQDLMFQTVAEKDVGLAVVAEPYSVPNGDGWVSSADDPITRLAAGDTTPFRELKKGRGFVVAAKLGEKLDSM